MSRRINLLTHQFCCTAPPGTYSDGNCLYFNVSPLLARSWTVRVVIHGRRRDLGLGSFPRVSLAEARQRALAIRAVARAGGDPTAALNPSAPAVPAVPAPVVAVPAPVVAVPAVPAPVVAVSAPCPTFREVTDEMIEAHRIAWRSPRTEDRWRRQFEQHVYPVIGDKPVSLVTVADLRKIVVPCWHGRGTLGPVLRQHLERVMDWAYGHQYRPDNPASMLKVILPKVKKRDRHYPSLPHPRVREAMAHAAVADADEAVKLALLFHVLCASRIGEVLDARWSEINIDGRIWTVPGDRMKSGSEHRVPLPEQALDLLARARRLDRSAPFLFVRGGPRGCRRPVPRSAVSRFLRSFGWCDDDGQPVVPHGFRATFRVWAMEVDQAPFHVAEAALAHVVTDRTVKAYARSDLFDRRVGLMQRWADYVMPRTGGQHLDPALTPSTPH